MTLDAEQGELLPDESALLCLIHSLVSAVSCTFNSFLYIERSLYYVRLHVI